jgi:hydrogenase maturation protein HypF
MKATENIMPVHFTPRHTILACGAEMKSAPCLLTKEGIILSKDLGHLGDPDNFRAFAAEVERLLGLCKGGIDAVACDMHPAYAATRHARTLGAPVIEVQHHHAHVVSCMAEHGLDGPVVGIACDGTGYGTDGAVWGCEVLVCEAADFTRFAHLRPFALPGGDAAAIETWRPAISLLVDALGDEWFDTEAADSMAVRIGAGALNILRTRLSSGASMAQTTSLGRLFDAAAFLTDLCDRNDTDAAAPIALQKAAEACEECEVLEWSLDPCSPGPVQMDARAMIRRLAEAGAAGADPGPLARGFHEAVASMLAGAANLACEQCACDRVVLSGGCFFNSLLRESLTEKLKQSGREVYNHGEISAGDAGIAPGQAVSATARLSNRENK